MEEILGQIVSAEDLERFERQYYRELEQGDVSHKAQFEYAWCLVRSQYSSDMHKGVVLLEDLCNRNSQGNRDYIYYLAIGNARLKNYSDSLKFIDAFLQVEPNNQQAISLKEHIRKKMEREGMIGMAVAGGAIMVLGGLVGIGMALAKK